MSSSSDDLPFEIDTSDQLLLTDVDKYQNKIEFLQIQIDTTKSDEKLELAEVGRKISMLLVEKAAIEQKYSHRLGELKRKKIVSDAQCKLALAVQKKSKKT